MFVGHPLEADGLVEFLLANIPVEEQAVWRQRLEEKRAEDICVAETDNGSWLVATVAQDVGGRASMIWAPAGKAASWQEHGQRIFAELRQRGFIYTQALLPPENRKALHAVWQMGMEVLTTMDYLATTLPSRPLASETENVVGQNVGQNVGHRAEPDPGLAASPFELIVEDLTRVEPQSRVCQIIERTYRDTLDCPELDDSRSVDDVVRGYAEAAPLLVWIMRDGREDAGVLILSDHPANEQTELTYMGLAPEYRGCGGGTKVIDFAIESSAKLGRKRMVLAVDRRNSPAIKHYESAGLRRWASRVCLIHSLEK